MAQALHYIKEMKAWYKIKHRLMVRVMALIAILLSCEMAFSQNIIPPDMPHPRVGMCSARLGSKLYLIGGAQKVHGEDVSSILSAIRGTSIVDAFDFGTMSWDTNIAPLNTPRAYATAVALDDSIYVMGGVDDSGKVLNTVEVYDPSNNEWHYASNMLKHREGAASVVYGDSIFVFGGGGVFDEVSTLHRLVEIYSPAAGVWTTDSTMTLGRIFHRAVKIGTAVYIIGGLGSLGPVGYVEKYIPGRGVVQIRFVWRFPRAYFDIAERGDSVFVISGYGQPSPLTVDTYYYENVEVLNFRMTTTTQDTGMEASVAATNPRVGFVAQLVNSGEIYLFGGLSPDPANGLEPLPSVGEVGIPTAVQEDHNPVPSTFSLAQNYPNPFNPSTAISYQLSAASYVTLEVYDVLGKEVSSLVNERQAPGSYKITFDGGKLSSGVYFYRLSAGRFTATKKMILAK